MFYNTPSLAIVHELLGDEIVIANLLNGVYYSLRNLAIPVWQLGVAGFSFSQIEEEVHSRFGKEGKDSLPPLLSFLLQEGLWVEVEERSSVERVDPLWPTSFCPPSFEKYSDMKDLLLLDPIHEVDAAGWPSSSTA